MSYQRVSTSFIEHASDVASFYGFQPLRDVERALPKELRNPGRPHNFASALQTCAARVTPKTPEPILAFHATPAPVHLPAAHLPRETGEFGLHVVGSNESLSEVILIKTLHTIMSEWGAPVARLRINSLGDRDSRVRFERELSAYVRKHGPELQPECRAAFAANPFGLYACTHEGCREILADGPRAINFLSEKSRLHFREVLEYIENIGLPYEIDDLLVDNEREPRVLFAFDLEHEDPVIQSAVGGRYDEHLRTLTNKKEGAAVSASIFFRKKGLERSDFTIARAPAIPKIYFVQLGARAKFQSLAVLDILRQARLPIIQSFDPKSIGPQFASANQLGVSHLFIMGHREALDGTLIIRTVANSSQQTVPLTMLPRFLKGLKV